MVGLAKIVAVIFCVTAYLSGVHAWGFINALRAAAALATAEVAPRGVNTQFHIPEFIRSGFYSMQCQLWECCDKPWIKSDVDGLAKVLKTDLHGQHLAIDVIVKSLRGHRRDDNPSKALVLSMHGWTGGGKNYVSRYIADHLFQQGYDKSSFVHLFVATLHFPHVSHLQTYKDQLSTWIKGNVTICPRSLFIFDEMDKMPAGLIDSIKPYLDHYHQLDGVDYRKATFLFLSNSGGNDITQKTKEHWEAGHKREDIQLREMEEIIKKSAYNEQGGLWHADLITKHLITALVTILPMEYSTLLIPHSLITYNEQGGLWHADLITKHLITAFVPFLPMERTHVKACIRDNLRMRNHTITEEIVDKVADELHYFPADSKLFSTSGCKRVPEKVNFIMEDY